MERLQELLNQILNISLVQGIISNPRTKDGILKIKVRPVEKKGKLYFHVESFTKTQAFHENLVAEDASKRILDYMDNFRQMQIEMRDANYTVLISKKGKVTIQKKHRKETLKEVELSHNRSKKYILQEGAAVPFLQDLGVMTSEGKIVRSRFDKFRQINRFLEFIEDILPQLERGRELTILDFGCGKSYLTFAMYYYLHELKQYDIRIIGLDLKREVISHCNELAGKYGYEKLTFLVGDIADYEDVQAVDMVVTLHACDTATDYALAKAIGWNAKVILSVPCCQHELNAQIASDVLAPVMEYGLLKERFAALVTDGLRAKYLESQGYDTKVLEFIDMEHTPKNILLRAVKTEKNSVAARRKIQECETFLQAGPTLGKLLYQDKRR
ncbi:class I SAM-dependent methyltransferase [Muricomes intestini]|uniref:class I SAM-dependent methyltransferase n=1 Tax=Muricomes intestini TaxID=1796634 RepID=UPI002FD93AF7